MENLAESVTLLNAQIGFLDTHLAMIHIPLRAYPLFLQPILQLLLHNGLIDEHGNQLQPNRTWNFWHSFVNISITSGECSIVCPRHEAQSLFVPVQEKLDPSLRNSVSISREDYSVIMIGGEGLEAGQRVLDLTSPLAMAGISIFFITSYWSDFILVPLKARGRVIGALEDRGFVFEADSKDGEVGHMTNPASPMAQSFNGHQKRFSQSSFDFPTTGSPGTPPPTSVSELQTRTFKQLKTRNISPLVDRSIELVTCAGVKDSSETSSATNFTAGKLSLGLIKCLASQPPPKFLSATLTDSDSASITLEKRLLSHFDDAGEDVLLGREGPEQVPITLDLRDMPVESTGIVCGVAGRLIDGMKGRLGREMFNVSYLSTTRAGHAIVYADELDDAVECLEGVMTVNGTGGKGG